MRLIVEKNNFQSQSLNKKFESVKKLKLKSKNGKKKKKIYIYIYAKIGDAIIAW